jgi:hypothetical protein
MTTRLKIKCLKYYSDCYDCYKTKTDLLLANQGLTELVYAPIMDRYGSYLCGDLCLFVNHLGVFKYDTSANFIYSLRMMSLPSLSTTEYDALVYICKTKYASRNQKKLLEDIDHDMSGRPPRQLSTFKWFKQHNLTWPQSNERLPLP